MMKRKAQAIVGGSWALDGLFLPLFSDLGHQWVELGPKPKTYWAALLSH